MAKTSIPKALRSIAVKAKRRLPRFRHVVVVLGSMIVGALLITLCTYTVGRLAAPTFRSSAVILDLRKPGLRENETDLHSVLTSPKVMKRIASNSKIASLFSNRTSDEVQNELFSNLSFHATPVSDAKRFSIGDTIRVSFDSPDREFARTVLEAVMQQFDVAVHSELLSPSDLKLDQVEKKHKELLLQQGIALRSALSAAESDYLKFRDEAFAPTGESSLMNVEPPYDTPEKIELATKRNAALKAEVNRLQSRSDAAAKLQEERAAESTPLKQQIAALADEAAKLRSQGATEVLAMVVAPSRVAQQLPAISIRGIKWSIGIGALAGFCVGLILNRRNSVPASNSKGQSK